MERFGKDIKARSKNREPTDLPEATADWQQSLLTQHVSGAVGTEGCTRHRHTWQPGLDWEADLSTTLFPHV